MVSSQPLSTIPIALIVSNDSYKHSYFKRILKELFHVVLAKDSFSSVDYLKSMLPSFIIIDEKSLPDTWMILAKHIRQLGEFREIPLLLITNNLKKKFLLKALNAGINDFLNEPFDSEEIYQRILVATQSTPMTKKMLMMTKKFKKIPRTEARKLTLPQRFVITEKAIKEIAKVQQKHHSLSLLLIELEHPQHEAQSLDLQRLLEAHRRSLDVLLPQGGGRFLFMLPKTSQRAAIVIAETLSQEAQAQAPLLGLSIGVAFFDETSSLKSAYDQFDTLLTKVNKALTKAKHKANKIASE